MAQQFSHTQYPITHLVEQIDNGDLELPDLQRPFVWERARIRDLFDSLYKGYPAGYFLFWSTTNLVDSHSVATSKRGNTVPKMIVDGQQRLTSLYAVIKGKELINADGVQQFIRIAFNPLTEEFAVTDATKEKDPEWLTSISDIWNNPNGEFVFTTEFIEKLNSSREVTDKEKQEIGRNLGKLGALKGYQFSALELSADLDIDEVADVFVRINSKGISLNSADFILTLMSVHAKEARYDLEDFCRAAKLPSIEGASPYNHFLSPSPDQMLRVAVGLGLKRGVLQNAYQFLRGKDPVTKVINEDLREKNFESLIDAQEKVLDLTNWHQFIVAVKRAGYRSGSMMTSNNNFLYCYLVFLIGKHEYNVGQSQLREAVARWFFMSALTGRYTGSPETIMESDLRRFAEATDEDSFVAIIDNVIDTQLTKDYWVVTLPDQLESSAARSPTLYALYASLNLLDAKALFSQMKMNELFDPGVTQTKSPVEKHHLFPKAYLSTIGITGTTRTNQIANYAFVEWGDNISISDKSPQDYFSEYFNRLSAEEQKDAQFFHALPAGWEDMRYQDFLIERRKLMAKVVEAGFEKLKNGATSPSPSRHLQALPTVSDLLRLMETKHVEFKQTARAAMEKEVPEKVINDGIVKTVAAFLNTEGGTLGIGITDDGDILGLQPDLDFKKQDLDGYQNWLMTLLITKISAGVVGSFVSLRFETVGAEMVCLVDVKPSNAAVYAKTLKSEHSFFVRMSNTTRLLEGPDIQEYIKNRF
ncbi:DUF262 domain-containing protein [Cocleimonas sp. KMM 6892]|uniref:GmrSD restriction endonuclease domain-containing protein n=1 Tax=unclassified Cocleimonas TaxID=2639732 RepID=UPI002DB8715F|nr:MULTISPECIES: DUF262 domain-containing protein [unclassified Cocleimonas]MEB8432977.1 DUF262 domain-containing protein [Cocleimonas sp. KMM 6892]MEC4716042.1 DUF262 domain-containing protein [Cocleimonas sp. KMM 6895]MEC4745503.1 DUF262 domain-containing protein [Cocleimonas sp. KMM 6896]